MLRARNALLLTMAASVVAAAGSLVAQASLPPVVPIHYNIRGEADGFGSPDTLLFIMPLSVVALAITGSILFRQVRDIGLRDRTLASVAYTALFLAAIHLLMLAMAGGMRLDFLQITAFGLFLLMAGLGSLLPGTPRNFFFGVRTPATLRSPEAWRIVHERVGKAYVRIGIAGLLLSLLPIPGAILLGIGVVGFLIPPLLPVGERTG